MDTTWEQRQHQLMNNISDSLSDMALDQRLMPGVASQLQSSASTPSLRSREGSVTPIGGKIDAPGGNVRVVVRVRGFLPREVQRGAQCLVEMNPITQETKLLPPVDDDPANARMKSRKVVEEKLFRFDKSFCSHSRSDLNYATQDKIYNSLGEEFLDHNFEGYHTCIFAYGQTGSGKSYTMMGTKDEPGLIPRTCRDLFTRLEGSPASNVSYNVRVSYFEVYNENVRDLLIPLNLKKQSKTRIREHPTEGPYVVDLTDVSVKNIDDIMMQMEAGDKRRTVASTKMNDTSSRSHAVFTIMLKQIHHDMVTDETTERTARIRLVDLAGSERQKATEATGERLKEGSTINKSLTTLGRVIAALADPKSKRARTPVVPYRDSILTWLLKDSLGGNSKTAMIACISPSDYDETLSTLRYADQAKRIRTSAIINQDHLSAAERDAQIAQMAEQIRALQQTLNERNERAQNDNSTSKPLTKAEKEMEEKNEELAATIARLSRMQEERSMIYEGKIRALQTENEALKLHLKLALETIKNPIPDFKPAPDPVNCSSDSLNGKLKTITEASDEDKENHKVVDEGVWLAGDDHEGEDEDVVEERSRKLHDNVREILDDLKLFKFKCRDDQGRWPLHVDSEVQPLVESRYF